MTTLTVSKSVDLTALSDETLERQIESNRDNAKKATDAINKHLLGERIVPGEKGSYRSYTPSLTVAQLLVGDLVAVTEISGTRWSRNSVSPGEDVTDRLTNGWGGWHLYVVTGKTAKRVQVRSVAIPNGYYDDPYKQGHGYANWPNQDYTEDTWGDKASRFIFPMGTLAEAQARLATLAGKVERFDRIYQSRQVMIAEVSRRKAIKDAEVEARRAPKRDLVAKVNKIAGMKILYFSSWVGNDGDVEWSYEMRGNSYSKDEPSRFVMGLAAQVIGLRRLKGDLSAKDYALVLDTVKALPGGEEFASSIAALNEGDDGTEDDEV